MAAEQPTPFMPSPPPYGGTAEDWMAWVNGLASAIELGLECEQIGHGHAVLRLGRSPWTTNPNGSENGGLVLAAADQCLGVVAVTTSDPGMLPSTATLNAEFHRPAFAPLTFRGRVTRRGRSLVFVEVDVEDEEGRLCVRCTGTMAMNGAEFHTPQ